MRLYCLFLKGPLRRQKIPANMPSRAGILPCTGQICPRCCHVDVSRKAPVQREVSQDDHAHEGRDNERGERALEGGAQSPSPDCHGGWRRPSMLGRERWMHIRTTISQVSGHWWSLVFGLRLLAPCLSSVPMTYPDLYDNSFDSLFGYILRVVE